MTRILLADDHEMVRDTIAAYLRSEGQAEVVCVPDLDGAIRAIRSGGVFDLVLLDFAMPGMNGLEGLTRMIGAAKGARVALLSGTAPSRIAQEAVEMGAAGFIPKSLGAKSLVNAVHFMIMGETFVPASVRADGAAGEESEFVRKLSRREREVLTALCLGKANKEIARDLDLQEVTVKLHVRTLCRKIGAKNRTHAAMIAKEAQFA